MMPQAASTTARPMPALPVWCIKLNRLIAHLLATKAHADITIRIRNGTLEPMFVNQSFLPADLPEVPG